jgi:ABC-2 type transport system ATP-binding protein
MNEEIVLEVKGLTKTFKNVEAVKSLDLTIRKGEVYGLLGPNGSGKTTTLAMLLGILHPSKGSYSWFGNGDKNENRLRIGSLLETPNFYPYLNAYDNLKVVGKIKKVANLNKRIDEVIALVDLEERGKRPFRTFSLGMKQRLAVAAALLSDPEVLDPQGIVEMRNLILEVAKQGKSIIFASHILAEVEIICSHVAILHNGDIVYNGTMKELMSQDFLFRLKAPDMNRLEQCIGEIPELEIVQNELEGFLVKSQDRLDGSKLNRALVEKGVYLSELHEYQKSLETIFLEKLKK